jgi:hypothetical protein
VPVDRSNYHRLPIDRPKLSAADIEKLKEATRNNKAAE